MASHLFLIPPDGAEREARAVTVRDEFAFLAFLCPPLWFAAHRMIFEAVASLALLVLAGLVGQIAAAGPAGALLTLAIMLLSGLEGQNLRVKALERRGYRLDAAIEAPDRDTADEIYFSRTALATRTPVAPAVAATAPFSSRPAGDHRPVLGLFDLNGGR